MVDRIGIVEIFVSVTLLSSTPLVPRRHEGATCKHHRPRTLADQKSHYAVVRHTQAYGSGAEPILDTVANILEEVPLLRFRSLILKALCFCVYVCANSSCGVGGARLNCSMKKQPLGRSWLTCGAPSGTRVTSLFKNFPSGTSNSFLQYATNPASL